MHSHIMIRNVVERAFRMGITPADTILMYLPLYHLFGFSEGMLMSLATGARQILTETFDPNESLRLLEMEQATILHGFDTHFKDLLQAHAAPPATPRASGPAFLPRGCRARCRSRGGAEGLRPPPLRLWHERGRRRRGAERAGLERGAMRRGFGLSGTRLRDQDHGPGDRPRSAGGRARRDTRARLHRHARLLPQARGDREGRRLRGLAALRRHGADAARWAPALHGALQGHAEDRRRERRSAGGRGLSLPATRRSMRRRWSVPRTRG